MQDSVFTKMLQGKIDAPLLYEDADTFAILDHNPVSKGHALVISKMQIDRLEDCSDALYDAMFRTVRKVSHRIDEQLKPLRTAIVVHGLDVPHVHIHVVPLYTGNEMHLADRPEGRAADQKQIFDLALKLRFEA